MIRFDADSLGGLLAQARGGARLRAHHTIHDSHDDPVQRMAVALQPGTYIRPHRHGRGVWEMFAVLAGRFALLTFDDEGRVLERLDLRAGGALLGQLPPGTWHSLVVLEPDTVMLEVKPGPYRPPSPEDFAAWAPPEGDAAAPAMVRWMETASAGDAAQD